MKKKKKPKGSAPRYGIAEWYGHAFTKLTGAQRRKFAAAALSETGNVNFICPFLGSLIPNIKCSKAGGVCSIRKYTRGSDGTVVPADDRIVSVCPSRFLENADVLRWVGEVVLGTSHPASIKEVPFLEKLETGATVKEKVSTEQEDEETKKAGRIDWILVESTGTDLHWCALETQAVYFSGKQMGHEFELYRHGGDAIAFPSATRRPDYRSSGPKRLAPQLLVKVPELRKWGRKTAVVVDEYFFDNMSELPQVSVRGGKPQDLLEASEVVWFVVGYDPETGRLTRVKHLYAHLDQSIAALNATRPVSKGQFEEQLRNLLNNPDRLGKKVFKL